MTTALVYTIVGLVVGIIVAEPLVILLHHRAKVAVIREHGRTVFDSLVDNHREWERD